MNILEILSLFTWADGIGLAFVFACWLLLGWRIEHPGKHKPSVTLIMANYRRAWMDQMVTRQPRIFDATILGSLRQGTSFFASGSMIAMGGLLAVVGNSASLSHFAEGFTMEVVPELIWQIKLLVVSVFLTHGFLKFVWANRLFGYCAVVMAATPNDQSDPMVHVRARQAAEVNIRAAWNFNRGLRSVYFALGTLAWLLGPYILMATTLVVTFLIWQREFSSHARGIVLDGWDRMDDADPAGKG